MRPVHMPILAFHKGGFAALSELFSTTHGRDPESALRGGWTSGPAVPKQEENLETEEKYT